MITAKILLKALQRAISFYGSFPLAIRRSFVVLLRDGPDGISRRINILTSQASQHDHYDPDVLYGNGIPADPSFAPKVSVIVPNFNHEKYLRQRLESVYGQSYDNFEVILLDDCSTDKSILILQEFAERYPTKTISSYNNVNSGGVFNQWKKGLELATGELVWIAESDDFCDQDFLLKLVPFFINEVVMLSFCRTDFVNETASETVWTSESYLVEFGAETWQSSFVKSAHVLFSQFWSRRNIIANVSSAVFRKPSKQCLQFLRVSEDFRVCGDWAFYMHIVRGGMVAYTPRTTNYYRQHSKNTSVSAHAADIFYIEHAKIAKLLVSLYRIDFSEIIAMHTWLKEHWKITRPKDDISDLDRCFDLVDIEASCNLRKPNLMMVGYALSSGGGETFPITLANLLYQAGYAVTYFNCHQEVSQQGIRKKLDPGIPLLELNRLTCFVPACNDLGIELVHTHHAWVDTTIASLLSNQEEIRQVITMHGMYEMLSSENFTRSVGFLEKPVKKIVYISEKNCTPFDDAYMKNKHFQKINNAVEIIPYQPVSRSSLGIPEDAFVLCLVSRAMPEKGWSESIAIASQARALSGRNIHLLLVGNGPEYERLQGQLLPPFIHLLGFKSNVRDYFSTSDLGLLISRFKGESFPLVLIECLHAGKPVLASNIGDIRSMLEVDGGMAGRVFDLDNWSVPIDEVTSIVAELAAKETAYIQIQANVLKASARFSPEIMISQYGAAYDEVLVSAT